MEAGATDDGLARPAAAGPAAQEVAGSSMTA
jgi:hypothetical protein